MKSTRHKAFTLIELLVVIAIIAILLSILAPAMRMAVLKTRLTKCMIRQRTISTALLTYSGSNNAWLPTPRLSPSEGGYWADAYGMRRDHPYGGKTDRPAAGFGLLVTSSALPDSGLGDIMHCPSFDNTNGSIAPGHCDDVQSSWGYGASSWKDRPGYRILVSYNYRGTSYYWSKASGRGVNEPPRLDFINSQFVTTIDTADLRFRETRSKNNEHGGYAYSFSDGSVAYFDDPTFIIDDMVDGKCFSGRQPSSNDELVYEYLQSLDR